MQNFNMLLDVVLPIGCALISGGLTVLGVLLTIKHENKKNKESRQQQNQQQQQQQQQQKQQQNRQQEQE